MTDAESITTRHHTERDIPDAHRQVLIEEWFLHRGMPMATQASTRWSRVFLRATPVLIGYMIISLLITIADLVLLQVQPNALDDPDAIIPTWFIWVLVGAIIVGIVVGIVVNRQVRYRVLSPRQSALLLIGVPLLALLITVPDWLFGISDALIGDIIGNAIIIVLIVGLTRLGVGSIFVWSIRQAAGQMMALVPLSARALPMILLVTLFSFLSSGLWEVTGRLSRDELWNVALILFGIAAFFAWVATQDELRSVMRQPGESVHRTLLDILPAGTIPADLERTDQPLRLSRREAVNAMAILLIAQAIQIGILVTLVFVFFCAFGANAVPPSVVELWTGHEATSGTLMGVRLPVHNELIQTALFLASFSAVIFAASSITDPGYRKQFFEPMLEEVAVTVTARHYSRTLDTTGQQG